MRTLMLPLRSTLAVCLSLAAQAQAFEFKPALQAEARGRYTSQQVSAYSGFGYQGNLLAVPALGFNAQHSLLPTLGIVRRSSFSPNSERGGAIPEDSRFIDSTTFFVKPTYRYKASESLLYKAWGGAKRAVNQETAGENWSTGKYDWEEFGGGLGSDWELKRWGLEKAGLGLEYHHRTYMNWHELGAQNTRNRHYYSKDYNGLKLSLDAKGQAIGAFGWESSLLWLNKGYTDNLVQKKDGTRDYDKLRQDSLLRWDADLSLALGDAWTLGTRLYLDWNRSNEAFFDTAFNEHVSDLGSYVAMGGGPSLKWAQDGDKGLVASLSVDLSNKTFCGRPIRQRNGVYTKGSQADFEQDYRLDMAYPLPVTGLSMVSSTNWLFVNSNQAYVTGFRNTYDLFQFNLGLKYKL